MSRQSMMPPRNLTLTEELERIEQSITLALQEIDANFSKAHRIVTSSIIPIVEQYAKYSDAVWDGSKFWKQFFEASANVSLSSYEENPEEDLTAVGQSEAGQERYGASATPRQQDVEVDDTVTETEEGDAARAEMLDSPSVTVASRGTPGRQRTSNGNAKQRASTDEASFAEYPSPYEALKAELKPEPSSHRVGQTGPPPTTPGAQTRTLDFADSSPIPVPPSTTTHPTTATRRQNPDRLLHAVLDKTYRLQATPHTAQRQDGKRTTASPSKSKQSPGKGASAQTTTTTTTTRYNPALDSSPFSPAPAAPQLRREIFGSPAVRGRTPGKTRNAPVRATTGPRTPGVSVQQRRILGAGAKTTPSGVVKVEVGADDSGLFSPSPENKGKSQPTSHARTTSNNTANNIWESDDEEGEDDTYDNLALSPPKTIQFHIPQSRILQTPAREASKQIVEGLLRSAGLHEESSMDEFEGEGGYREDVYDEELDLDLEDEGVESPSRAHR